MFDGGSASEMEIVLVGGRRSWEEIDRELRAIAKRQRALDAEEAALLCTVVRERVWREFGHATLLEYLEDVFGYGPKVAHERVRVALAIDAMPDLRDALEAGEVSYSALREITRVATEDTVDEWLDETRGKNLRQIEELVRTHRKGARPTDPADPSIAPRRHSFEYTPATEVLVRQARQALATERGHFIEDDEYMAAAALALLESGSSSDQSRAKYQVRVTVCSDCDRAVQEGGGRKIAIGHADVARAECDAQRIGDDERATQDVPPKTRRFVYHRDGGKCCVPSCRSARFNEVHHVVARADGGSHDATNLTLLCDGHHGALHEGKLTISGLAPNLDVRFVRRPRTSLDIRTNVNGGVTPATSRVVEVEASNPHVETRNASTTESRVERSQPPMTPARSRVIDVDGSSTRALRGASKSRANIETSRYALATMAVEAKQALRYLEFTPAEAKRFVEAGLAELPNPSSLQELIACALKHSRIRELR